MSKKGEKRTEDVLMNFVKDFELDEIEKIRDAPHLTPILAVALDNPNLREQIIRTVKSQIRKARKPSNSLNVSKENLGSSLRKWVAEGKIVKPNGYTIEFSKEILAEAIIKWFEAMEEQVKANPRLRKNNGFTAQGYAVTNAISALFEDDFTEKYYKKAVERAKKLDEKKAKKATS